jgi:hypothetical protein
VASTKDREGTAEFRAPDLAKLLSTEIMDKSDAAAFLGIAKGSLEYAAYRKRIPFVQYGAKKLFTRADLMDYARNRGHGKTSRLETVAPEVVMRGPKAAKP